MNRKIFKADNIQQAIANIKEELGSDALILNTRKIPKRPLDPYAKEMVEVANPLREYLLLNQLIPQVLSFGT